MKSFFIIIFSVCFFPGISQNNDLNYSESSESDSEDLYYDNTTMRYDNREYKDYIKTVTLHKPISPVSGNVLHLNSNDRLILGFDDLEGEIKDYNYTVIHCNSSWEPSDLMETEYIDGFYDNYISNYDYSFNTLEKYIHYEFVFPNDDVKLTKSGNYLFYVFEDNDQEKPILTRRFMVTENGINIFPFLKPASKIADRDFRQEIDFNLTYGSVRILNPISNLKVILQQNGRFDNQISGLKPIFIKDNELVYDYDEKNVFDGNNEFRFFDFKSFNYKSLNILDFSKNDTTNFIYLKHDLKRTYKNYYSVSELNGKYVIDCENSNDPDIDSDYGFVRFSLKYPEQISGGDLYIFGAISDWKFKEECKLTYNEKAGFYEANIYLKQGYYNYQYALLKDNESIGSISFIEGNHFDTENDYTIYVYYHDPTDRFERLIGVRHFNSLDTR
jgi:hypothetical protein